MYLQFLKFISSTNKCYAYFVCSYCVCVPVGRTIIIQEDCLQQELVGRVSSQQHHRTTLLCWPWMIQGSRCSWRVKTQHTPLLISAANSQYHKAAMLMSTLKSQLLYLKLLNKNTKFFAYFDSMSTIKIDSHAFIIADDALWWYKSIHVPILYRDDEDNQHNLCVYGNSQQPTILLDDPVYFTVQDTTEKTLTLCSNPAYGTVVKGSKQASITAAQTRLLHSHRVSFFQTWLEERILTIYSHAFSRPGSTAEVAEESKTAVNAKHYWY